MSYLNVFPEFVGFDPRNAGRINSELLGYSFEAPTFSNKASNAFHFLFRKAAHSVVGTLVYFNASVSVGVKVVFRACDVLKIVSSVVGSFSVNVVDFKARRARTDEGKHHKTMDVYAFALSFLGKINAYISCFARWRRLEYFFRSVSSHKSCVGDTVEAFVAWNLFPSHVLTITRKSCDSQVRNGNKDEEGTND